MSGQVYPCIIGGEKVFSSDGKTFKDINPADVEDVVGEFPLLSKEDVMRAIEAARKVQMKWALIPPPERGRILIRAAQIMENESEELARILTREEGEDAGREQV